MMLTLGEILNCEGYYYNLRTRDVLRNVGTGEAHCWAHGSWVPLDGSVQINLPQFELITPDVSMPFEKVQRLVTDTYGPQTSRRIINRQTARQADGQVVTEEAHMTFTAPTKVADPVCGMEVNSEEAAGKSEYQGHTYYFCNPSCQQQFNQNPQQYADRS